MQKLNVFEIYDAAMKQYSTPFFSPTKGTAIRDFTAAAEDPNTTISRSPADFTLFQIGVWDSVSGIVEMNKDQVKDNLGMATEYKIDAKQDRAIHAIHGGE